LIAEDDYLVSQMIKGSLEEIGYTVVGEAVDGLEAVEMSQSLKPDVILMDIKMPDMDGIKATQRIHESCPTPVVVLTAYETQELVEQASTAGVGAYLVKPPSAQEIERAITIAMARFDDMIELRRLNADLQTRNEELDAFAHTVAHDLQNPLNLIVGNATTLQAEARLPEELHHCLNTIVRNGQKMSNIIDELQLLAGVRKTEVELKPLNMGRIVAEAQQRLAHLVAEHQAKIIFPEDWPIALGHAPWIEEVWANYLSNGIKYGGQPPRLQLGATARSDNLVRFWVRDNGPGLTPEEQARLFIPFTQLSQTSTKGYGLGLSITRRIVERLGGQVGVESEGIAGQGCVFFFTLPSETE
jgi:signal transduction histidine kinase